MNIRAGIFCWAHVGGILALGALALGLAGCASTGAARLVAPDAIHDKGESVFKIVVLSEEEQTSFEPVQYAFLLEDSVKGDFLDFLYGERVKECKRKREKRCSIHFAGFATAFLAGDNRTLWTVRHAFDSLLEERLTKLGAGGNKRAPEELYRALQATEPQILLYDRYKNLVFDSRGKKGSVHFAFLGDPKFMREFALTEFVEQTKDDPDHDARRWADELSLGVAGKLTDIAKIELSQPLNAPALSFAKKVPVAGDAIYLLGYPTRSQRQAVYGAKYYDGHSFHVSPGHATTAFQMFHKIFEKFNERAESESKVFHLFEKYFYYHDAPSAEGFSGGPILNESGEIVTLQSSGTEAGGFGLQPGWTSTLLQRFDEIPLKK